MQDPWLFVGSFTQGKAPALHAFHFRTADGTLAACELAISASPDSCLFVQTDPQGRWLLAADHTERDGDAAGGSLYAYTISRTEGSLRFLNRQPIQGRVPCYLDVHREGGWAVAGNYSSGSLTILPMDDTGNLGPASQVIAHHPQKAGQKPRVHCARFDPTYRHVIAADLGLDQLIVYHFDASTGQLTHGHTCDLAPRSGPRHLAFSPDGACLYCISEYSNQVQAFDWHPDTGHLHAHPPISSLPAGYTDKTFAADLHVHPNGRFLYSSNRGHESIAIFALHERGAIEAIGHEPTRGNFPRSFAIDASGRWLIVGNENSDRIDVFGIDPATGQLTHAGSAACQRPASLKLIPQA